MDSAGKNSYSNVPSEKSMYPFRFVLNHLFPTRSQGEVPERKHWENRIKQFPFSYPCSDGQ